MKYTRIEDFNPFINMNILAHFTSCEIGVQKILFTNQLRFEKLIRSVDPFEEDLSHMTTTGPNSILKTTDQTHYPILVGTNDALQKIFEIHQKIKVLCFSYPNNNYAEIADSAPFLNAKMWIEYGKNQSGMCFVFNKENIILEFQKITQSKKHNIVNYKTTTELINNRPEGNIHEYLRKGKEDYTKELIDKYLSSYVFDKHISFNNENEYRMCVIPSDNEDVFLDISNSLVSIIVTSKIEPFLLDYLLNKYSDSNINIYSIEWRAREVILNRVEI